MANNFARIVYSALVAFICAAVLFSLFISLFPNTNNKSLVVFDTDRTNPIAATAAAECNEGWVPYKDEYCYAILDPTNVHTFEEAHKLCQGVAGGQGASSLLVHPRTQDEQDFLVHYIFITRKVVDNVWLGAKYYYSDKGSGYNWIDGFPLLDDHTNWAQGYPKRNNNLTGMDHCVQMSAEKGSAQLGKWVDGPCQRKSLAVCQRQQHWSTARLQQMLLEERRKREKMQQSFAKLQQNFDHAQRNPVPVGFIYVQLPKDSAPAEIWPYGTTGMVWRDVSADYKNLFFRVEGSLTAPFGAVQEGNSSRLVGVEYGENKTRPSSVRMPNNGGWSDYVSVSQRHGSSFTAFDYLRFEMSAAEEVRPTNMAMRVWKRIA